eukprot:1915415-Alexandrium_andersonii.AAC.1
MRASTKRRSTPRATRPSSSPRPTRRSRRPSRRSRPRGRTAASVPHHPPAPPRAPKARGSAARASTVARWATGKVTPHALGFPAGPRRKARARAR